jgi:D-alanyl-lipoteichoic acid acyltransferase DltB (MBOAT superfamily)
MLFNSPTFLIFGPLIWAAWWILGRTLNVDRRHGLIMLVLLVASFVFYCWQDEWIEVLLYFLLMFFYCLVDWLVGLSLAKRPRRSVLALGILFNLVVLGFFKYAMMLMSSLVGLYRLGGGHTAWEVPEIILPVGISFYAFTGIAYMVDVYRGHARAEPSFTRFALFISFYPQLVAGPILRAEDFLTSLRRDTMPYRPNNPMEAWRLIARGFFKKMVLADSIALAIDPFFKNVVNLYATSDQSVWSLPFVWLYALQIYFDFSGYTDIARGLGLLFGFRWPINFNLPYLAVSIRDFWRRWHMTLSSWLRDYLYIALGGSRRGPVRALVNLMITMLLGGLWHGPSWSFMMWGGLHGLYLVGHRLWTWTPIYRRAKALKGLARFVYHWLGVAFTFHLVCFAWVFFRITDFGQAWVCARRLFTWDVAFAGGSANVSLWVLMAAYGVISMAVSFSNSFRMRGVKRRIPAPLRIGFAVGFWTGLFIVSWFLSPAPEGNPFIYFQF